MERTMKRREFIGLLGGAAAWTGVAVAQKDSVPVIGFLSSASLSASQLLLNEFRKGLAEAATRNKALPLNIDGLTDVMIYCQLWPRIL
jgi:hypothetical protein